VIWYSTDEADTTDQYLEPYESADFLPRWIKALKEDRPMVVDDGRSMAFSPDDIQNDKDVLVHLFGNLTIYTSHGVLTEEKINSQLITILFGYLVTVKKKYHRSIELARVVYPDTIADKQNPTKNLVTLVHRLNNFFGKISDIPLIPTEGKGIH